MSEAKTLIKIKIRKQAQDVVKIPTENLNPVAKSGVFIHWGIYSIPAFSPHRKTVPKTGVYNGSEWYLGRLKNTFLYKYDTRDYHNAKYGPFPDSESAIQRYYDFIAEFEEASINWDPVLIVDKIKQTGAKYIIITAKHHDGVCLYPSEYGMYHTKRDYIGELAKATRAAGLQFGIYYSLMEWTSPPMVPPGSQKVTTETYSTGATKVSAYISNVLIPQLKEIVTRYQPDILWN